MSVSKRTAALVLAPALALALVGCASDRPASEPTAAGSSPAASSSSSSPTPSSAVDPVRPKNATIVRGTGYSFAMPKGWADLTRKMRPSQPSLDVAVGNTVQTDGFASNMAVNLTPTGAAGTDTIDDVAAQILATVKKQAPKYRIQPHATVAGLPAAHLSGMYTAGKQRYWLEQFVVVGEQQTIVISFSLAPGSSEKERSALIDSVLKSWMIES